MFFWVFSSLWDRRCKALSLIQDRAQHSAAVSGGGRTHSGNMGISSPVTWSHTPANVGVVLVKVLARCTSVVMNTVLYADITASKCLPLRRCIYSNKWLWDLQQVTYPSRACSPRLYSETFQEIAPLLLLFVKPRRRVFVLCAVFLVTTLFMKQV